MRVRLILAVLVVMFLVAAVSVAVRVLTPEISAYLPAADASRMEQVTIISITFSTGMQPESVLDNLSIEPETSGMYTWEGNTLIFTPDEPWPKGEQVSVQIGTGAFAAFTGLQLEEELAWSFSVRATELAFLWPTDRPADIFTIDPISGDSRRLTEIGGVLDFDVDARGELVYFSATNVEGGSNIFQINQDGGGLNTLYSCDTDLCQNLNISPNGKQLAFEHTADTHGGAEFHREIWILSLDSLKARRVSQRGNHTRLPDWSAMGLLSYYDVDEQAFILLNTESDQLTELPNQTGEVGSWSPDGETFLTPELFLVISDIVRGPSGEAENSAPDPESLENVQLFSSHLLAYNPRDDIVIDLTKESVLEDTSPTYSPDGRFIAFSRKYLDEQRWTTGRQFWLMDAIGTGAQSITDEPNFKHTAFAWHPNNQQIAYMRFNQTLLTEPPEIWIVNLDGSDPLRLVIGGFDPQWIP